MNIKAAKILRSNKGETIMESIISLLMFAVLIIGVTEMITAALKITGNSIENAGAVQENVNAMVLEDISLAYDPEAGTNPITLESDSITFEWSSGGIDTGVTHNVDVFIDDRRITAFIPHG